MKQTIKRQLYSCIVETFNGFHIACMEYDKKARKKFSPTDIIYKPVKHQKIKINCYFSNQMHLAYRSTYTDDNKLKHGSAWHCLCCSKLSWSRKQI